MLNLALLTPNTMAADAIEHMLHGSDVFKVGFRGTTVPPAHDLGRALRIQDPEVILLDLGDWELAGPVLQQLRQTNLKAVILGFKQEWNRLEELTFQDAGIKDILREPFSPEELESLAYEALHRERPPADYEILAFLPAKAGGGCSTVAMNTAGAIANQLGKKVLLMDSDRRSGILSILLNVENRSGMAEALRHAAELTPVEWQQYYVQAFGVHVLASNPARPGPMPSWADYYQLLRYFQKQYEYVVVDMPEVVNQATAEVITSARGVFLVCTPEIPSLKLAKQRFAEIEACKIPREKVHVVVNRWERGTLSMKDMQDILGLPVFATVPNSYKQVKKAIFESRLVESGTAFSDACEALARKASGLQSVDQGVLSLGIFKKLGKMME